MAQQRVWPIEILTPEEIDRLIKAGSRKAPTGIRNRALIGALYYGGLRIQEALDLEVRDVDLDSGAINVRSGKGSRQRVAGLPAAGLGLLEHWLEVRRKRGLARSKRVFVTLQGKPVWHTYVRAMLARYAQRARIEKRVHPHGLRHSHAHYLVSIGVPANEIQAQLGHVSLATTGAYLDAIAPVARVRRLRNLEWPVEPE